VADLYEMKVEESKEGTRLVWRQKPAQQQWLEAREGAYLLRKSDGGLSGGVLEAICPADGSGSRISHTQERAGHPTAVPSTGKTGESARPGCLSRLCPASDAEASVEAECLGLFAGRSPQILSGIAQRGYRTADDRRQRDLAAPH
jgi:hypothetical protein